MADYSGQQLGNYRVIGLIGRGGFADVYLGEHNYLKVQVALKVLSTTMTNQEDMDSFLKEAQTIARLIHPHIIRVTDFGVEHDVPFLVMDYAPNGTLRQRHPNGTRIPLATIVPYVRQLAGALQHAHEKQFIHRDVKPENMLVGERNNILLSDFGIALIAQNSRYQNVTEMIGTVPYMAPEQIQGKPRPASDQYALAVIVYEWLTGERPFRGSFTEIATQHVLATPPSLREKLPMVSTEVEEVILTALSKQPNQRFKSIVAFANALEQAAALASRGKSSSPPFSVEPLAKASLLSIQSAEASPLLPVQAEKVTPFLESSSPASMPATEANTPRPAIASPSDDTSSASVQMKQAVSTPDEQNGVSRSRVGHIAMRLTQGIGKRQVLAVALGILLYGGASYAISSLYKADSSVVTDSLPIFSQSIDAGIVLADVALIIPLFVAAIAGPLAGLLTVATGLYLGDLFAGYSANADYYGGSWTWIVGRVLIGIIAGLAVFVTRGRYTTARSLAIVFAMSTIGIIIGTVFTTYGDIWVAGKTADDASTGFSILALPAMLDPVLLLILLAAYSAIASRRAS